MVYQANVVNIMIVSPGDVKEERDVIQESIAIWNSKHSEEYGVILKPLRWEIDSYAEVGDHPQTLLNRQIVTRSDMAIAVFWARLGTPTTAYESGSVEELQEHVLAGKPAMLYFSQRHLPQDHDVSEFERLKNFKKEFRNKCKYSEYNDEEDLRRLLDRELHNFIRDKFGNYFKSNSHASDNLNETSELNDLAIEILNVANETDTKSVRRVEVDTGIYFRAGDKNFGEVSDPRSLAEAKHAFELLKKRGYLEDNSPGSSQFNITKTGFDFIDNHTSLSNQNDSRSDTYGGELILLQKMSRHGTVTFTEYYERGYLEYSERKDFYSTDTLSHKQMLEFKGEVDKLLEKKLIDRRELDPPDRFDYGETFVGKFLISPTSKGYEILSKFSDQR